MCNPGKRTLPGPPPPPGENIPFKETQKKVAGSLLRQPRGVKGDWRRGGLCQLSAPALWLGAGERGQAAAEPSAFLSEEEQCLNCSSGLGEDFEQ